MVERHELCSSGRAGYGASLDGMVSILYQLDDELNMIFVSASISGLIPTILVMWGHCPTRRTL